MDLIDVFGIEFNNNSEKVDQISFLKLGRRKIRVKNCGFPPLDGTIHIDHEPRPQININSSHVVGRKCDKIMTSVRLYFKS